MGVTMGPSPQFQRDTFQKYLKLFICTVLTFLSLTYTCMVKHKPTPYNIAI